MLIPDPKSVPKKGFNRGAIALVACMLAGVLIAIATRAISERRSAGDERLAQPGSVRITGGAVVALSATPPETRLQDRSYPSECAAFDDAAQHYLATLSGITHTREAQRTLLASAMFHDAAVSAPNVHARTGLVNSCSQAKQALAARLSAKTGGPQH